MLQLINAGLGRTGTTSLQVALERLGLGPCFHMFDVVGDERRLRQWEEIVCDGGTPDWAAVFDGYTSVVDGPCALYYREIGEAFPEAKMILTVRDAERWYQKSGTAVYLPDGIGHAFLALTDDTCMSYLCSQCRAP